MSKQIARIYYYLEPAGEERLRELIQEYEDVTQGIFKSLEKKVEPMGNLDTALKRYYRSICQDLPCSYKMKKRIMQITLKAVT